MISRALKILRQAEMAAAIAMLAVLVAVVFAGAAGRYSGYPVIWSDELAQALFVWISLLAADLTLQRSGHFRLDMQVNFLPRRARIVLDIAITLLVGALLLLLLVYALRFVAISNMRPLPMIGIPSSFATAALPVGFTLMLVTLTEQLLLQISGRGVTPQSPPRDVG